MSVVKEAMELIDCLLSEKHISDKRLLDQFWQCMSNSCARRKSVQATPTEQKTKPITFPMTDAEAKRFSRKPMPAKFHKFASMLVCDVPHEYLAYLTDDDDFIRMLKRYMSSGYYRQIRRQEDHE